MRPLELGLVDGDDPITEIVVTAMVNITSMGELDPASVKEPRIEPIGARRHAPNAA